MSKQAAQIITGNSENFTPTVPAMAFYISALVYDRSRMQEPNFISKMNIRQRRVDPDTGMMTNEQGDAFTVERLMPVPYLITIKLDIWTSNTEQKFQLIEQIATLFNPALEIQSTDNYIDWTSLSYVLLTDVQWSSRTVPVGSAEEIDIATLTFDLPVWISPPTKVTKMGVIQKIIASMYNSDGDLDDAVFDPNRLMMRRSITIMNYGVVLINNTLQLIKYNETYDNPLETDVVINNVGKEDMWRNLINVYGTLVNGTSEIRLELDDGTELVGTVAYHPTDETLLLFTPFVDTVPSNTLSPINAIINPTKVNASQMLYDNNGNYSVTTGTRFMILEDINSVTNTDFAVAWTPNGNPLVAHANDIIEFDGSKWSVVFDSTVKNKLEYVTNLTTGIQYKWSDDGWIKSYEGVYREAKWRIVL
jgi:hypothetical protein